MTSAFFLYGGFPGHFPYEIAEWADGIMGELGFEVTHTNDPHQLDQDLTGYDVIVCGVDQAMTTEDLTDRAERSLLDAVAQGTGSSAGTGRRRPSGPACSSASSSAHRSSNIRGREGGGPLHRDIVDREHDITRGVDDFQAASEQYYMHDDPAVHVLATTTFTGEHLPWGRWGQDAGGLDEAVGQGAGFYQALGHLPKDVQAPPVEHMVRQGLRWAAATRGPLPVDDRARAESRALALPYGLLANELPADAVLNPEGDVECDIAIIGSGMGGSTLAYAVRESGARVVVVERGDFLPREWENWSPEDVHLRGRYKNAEDWYDAGWGGLLPRGLLLRRRQHEGLWGPLPRFREADFGAIEHPDGTSAAWPVSDADMEPFYARAEQLYGVHGKRGTDPTEPWCSGEYPFPPLHHEPAIATLADAFARQGVRPFVMPPREIVDRVDAASAVALAMASPAWWTPRAMPRSARFSRPPRPAFICSRGHG